MLPTTRSLRRSQILGLFLGVALIANPFQQGQYPASACGSDNSPDDGAPWRAVLLVPVGASLASAPEDRAMTTPYVAEALTARGAVSAREAGSLVTEVVVGGILRPGTAPVKVDRIDWASLGLAVPG